MDTSASADQFRIHSVKNSGKMLGVSEQTVYRMISRGDIRTIKLGTSHRIREVDLVAWLESYGEQSGVAA